MHNNLKDSTNFILSKLFTWRIMKRDWHDDYNINELPLVPPFL